MSYEWRQSEIILICGTGGVGKTTISASVALDLAMQGYRTAVLTVDPAKRLAQALGIDKLTHKPQFIDLKEFKVGKSGHLDAMMLNTKEMFDTIIERYSPNKESKKKILEHPLYKHLSTMLAGSQEYMAMENLSDIVESKNYDRIVVDTPPSRHALDFLDSPEKMANALTNSMIKMLIRPYQWAGKKGAGIIKVFSKFTGAQFLQELSDFLSSTVTLLDGFKDRAHNVMELIKSESTEILLITSPKVSAVTDSAEFIHALEQREIEVSNCIINRMSARFIAQEKDLNGAITWTNKLTRYPGLSELSRKYEEKHKLENKLIKGLKDRNSDIHYFGIPEEIEEIHNLKGLNKLFQNIFKL